MNEFSLFYKIIGSFQGWSVLIDLLAVEDSLRHYSNAIDKHCVMLAYKKIQEKYTSYKLPFNWVGWLTFKHCGFYVLFGLSATVKLKFNT